MPKSLNLNKRQELVVNFLEENKKPMAVSRIVAKVNDKFKKTARITVSRLKMATSAPAV